MFEVPEEEDTGGIKTTIRIVDVENIKNIVNTARRAKNKYFSAETFDTGDLDPIQIAELMKLALDNTKARQLIEGLNLDP